MRQLLTLRIPTILGLILLFGGVGATAFLSSNTTITASQAATDTDPRDIRLTNVTDSSLTISYTTKKNVLGTLTVGDSNPPKAITLDDRDLSVGSPRPHSVHYFTLTDLRPNAEYFFTILSGNSTYLQKGNPFIVKTGPVITGRAPDFPLFMGSVVLPEGTQGSDVLLYLQSDSTQPVSTVIKPDGRYIISLANFRTEDTAAFAHLQSRDIVHLLFVSPVGNSSVAIHSDQKSPLPIVILTKNYDFTYSPSPVSSATSLEDDSFPILNAKAVKGAKTSALIDQQSATGSSKKNATKSSSIDSSHIIGISNKVDIIDQSQNPFISLANAYKSEKTSSGSPLLLSGILAAIALGIGFFLISFIRRVSQ